MSDHGLRATLERYQKSNEQIRRRLAASYSRSMGLTEGETVLLTERYNPDDIEGGWQEQPIRQWLDDQYRGAVYIEGEDV